MTDTVNKTFIGFGLFDILCNSIVVFYSHSKKNRCLETTISGGFKDPLLDQLFKKSPRQLNTFTEHNKSFSFQHNSQATLSTV